MFYFPCASCGTPMAITDIHAWLGPHPACSDGCAQQARNDPRLADARTPPEVLAATIALLLETGELVRVTAERAARAERDLEAKAMLSSGPAVFAIGVLPGAIAGAMHEASEDAFSRNVYDIEERLRRILRNGMALEAHGVPAAQHLFPIATRYGSLSSASGGMQGVLTQLWHLLKGVYDALEAWRANQQGPFR